MAPYYCITDFEGIDYYFRSKKEALSRYEKLVDEAEHGGWDSDRIDLIQFDLVDVPKRELVMRLLGQYEFMTNKKIIK